MKNDNCALETSIAAGYASFFRKFHLEALEAQPEAQPEALEALRAQKLLYMVLEACEKLQLWAWLHD